MIHFNEVATEILKKHNCEFSIPNLKLYECEIDISANKLKPFLRNIKNVNNKDWIILEVNNLKIKKKRYRNAYHEVNHKHLLDIEYFCDYKTV